MQIEPHDFWQTLYPADALAEGVQPMGTAYAAALPDGRRIALPLRTLPRPQEKGEAPDRAVASLIVNQASFAVLDALSDTLADLLRPFGPEVIIAVPTLGLPLAEGVARRLGHPRMVALGTSRKFWYDDALSEPLKSITSPVHGKTVFLDPRMLALLQGKRIAIVDDVISTGSSMHSVLRLMWKAELAPVAIGAAMLQGKAWREHLASEAACPIVAALQTPVLVHTGQGWQAE